MASITADLLKNTHTPKPVSQHLYFFSIFLFDSHTDQTDSFGKTK